MSYAVTRCAVCCAVIPDTDAAHIFHSSDCPRMMNGSCVCSGWTCVGGGCCRDDACTPLAARLRAAHDAQVALGDFPVASTRGLVKKHSGS